MPESQGKENEITIEDYFVNHTITKGYIGNYTLEQVFQKRNQRSFINEKKNHLKYSGVIIGKRK